MLRRIALTVLPAFACFPPAFAEMPEPAPLEAYGRLPVMSNPVLSPSGERYAFVATVKGERRLFVRTVAGEPLATSSIDEIKVRDITWVGDSFVLLTISDTVILSWGYDARQEISQMIAVNVADGEVRSLLQSPRAMNIALGFYGYGRRDGEWRAYVGALPMSRSKRTGRLYVSRDKPNLLEANLDSGGLHTVARSRTHRAGWLVGHDGAILANEQYESIDSDWRLYAGEGWQRPIARLEDPLGLSGILGQGRTPGTVLYKQADTDGRVHYMQAPLSGGGKPAEILAGENVQAPYFDPVTGLLAGFVRDGDHPSLVLFDEAHRARLDAARRAFPERNVRFVSADRDFDRLIVETDGAGDAGTWWLVDAAAGRAEILGQKYPGIRGKRVAPVRTIDYRAADGLALHGLLTLPPGRRASELPLVVLPHGGPTEHDYPGFHWLAQAFASRGYAVWQPNFRGSSGHGFALLEAGYGEWGRKMQTDISDGVAELARRGIVDPERACIVGASYGGYAALAGVTLQQGLYRCAVSVAGISDLEYMLQRVRRFGQYDLLRHHRLLLGAESIFDDVLDERSPVNRAERADAPVLLIHGKDDVVVPIQQSERMRDALEDAGKPVEMLILDSEDHWLSRESTRTRMLNAAVEFVQRHMSD